MNFMRRVFVLMFAWGLVSLAACGGSSANHSGNSAGNSSPSGSSITGSAGKTGICTLLSKSQIQQIFGFTVGFTDFTDPYAQSATDTSALCIFSSTTSASDGVTLGGNVSTTPAGAKQAYVIDAGNECPQPLTGLGDEACTDFNSTTSSYEIFVLKGDTEISIDRTIAAQDVSVPGKLEQAARIVLAGVH